MRGIIGKKIGMTTIFTEEGISVPCTVVEAGPNVVTQVKTVESDGYNAIQIAYGERKEKNTPNPLKGHFAKAKTTPKTVVTELRDYDGEAKLGDNITLDEFTLGEFVDAIGKSKGKGFQGVVKRHGFAGVGGQTHGQHNRNRAPGSIGAASFPSRVFKGMRMGGRMGGDRVKITNLEVVKIMKEDNLIVLKGAVPGHKGSYVILEK